MADLKELWEKFKGKPDGGITALGQAASHPIDTLKGATIGAGMGIGSFLGKVGADTWQAVSGQTKLDLGPLGVHEPHDPIRPGLRDVNSGEVIPEWNQRLASAANAATLGLRPMFWENYDKTKSIDKTIGNMAYEILPLGEIKAGLTGMSRKNPGEIMSPEEYGENLTMGVLKFLPVAKGARSVRNFMSKGVTGSGAFTDVVSTVDKPNLKVHDLTPPDIIDTTTTKINDLKSKIADARKQGLPDIEIGLSRELMDVMDQQRVVTNMRPGFISEVFNKAEQNNPGIWNNVFLKSLQEAEASGKPIARITEQIADTVENNPAIMDTIKDIGQAYGMTPMELGGLYPAVAHSIRSMAKTSGQTLKDISNVSRQADRFFAEILKDNPELAGAVDQLRGKNLLGASPVPAFTMLMNRFNAYSDTVRGALTSGIPTATRNLTSGGLQAASMLFDDIAVGTYKYAAGKGLELFKKTDRAPTLKEAYSDMLVDLVTMQQHLHGGARSIVDWFNDSQSGKLNPAKDILNGLDPYIDEANKLFPTVTKNLFGAPVDDLVHVNLMSGGLSKAKSNITKAIGNIESVGDGARFALSILSTPNIVQEMFWRKYFFVNEMRKNAPRLGFKDVTEMFEDLRTNEAQRGRWFGPEVTAESLKALRESGQLDKLIEQETAQYRLGNAEANKGRSLHSTEVKPIMKTASKEATELNNKFAELEKKLADGGSIQDLVGDLDPTIERVLGGQVINTGNLVFDAAEKALKNTMAYTPPRGTGGYRLLETFKQLPILYALGTPFPRFLLNATNWMIERDPTELHKMFSPKFAKEMVEIAKDPTKISDWRAAERFGKAQSGAMMWAAAHAIRNSKYAGPKYYQLNAGKDAEGNDKLIDLRVYRPFDQFLFIDHVMTSVAKGQDVNLTAAELTDAVLGLRRLNEVGIFAVSDIIRQVDSSNPDAFVNSLKPIAGQYMAGVLTPFRIPTDIAAAFGHEPSAEQKDLTGNELFGPSINQIPGLRDVLPARQDPFTGKPATSQHPGIRLLGPNVRNVSVLEQFASETGLPMNDLFGNYSDPEADRLVRQKIGSILGQKTPNGQTMANYLGEQINRAAADKPIEFKRDLVRTLFSQFREAASQAAMAENPMAFMEHVIRQQPETLRPILRDKLNTLKEKQLRDRNNK